MRYKARSLSTPLFPWHITNLIHPVWAWSVSVSCIYWCHLYVYTLVCWWRGKLTSLGRVRFFIFKRGIWTRWSWNSFQLINHVIFLYFQKVNCKRIQWHRHVLLAGYIKDQGFWVPQWNGGRGNLRPKELRDSWGLIPN